MTSKLTIEQAKRLRNDFECWQQDYDPKQDKEQHDMFGRGMAAMDMLIAGMYQEPVAWRVSFTQIGHESNNFTKTYWDEEEKDRWVKSHELCGFKVDIELLYTAPPVQAALDSEPVAYMWDSKRNDIDAPGFYFPEHLFFAESNVKQWGGEVIPLYRHAQQPVVDADDNFYSWFGREWHENYQHNQYTTAAKQVLGVMAESAWKAATERQRQKQSVSVPDVKIYEDVPYEVGRFKTHRDCYCDGWNACRAAMLQAGTLANEDTKQAGNSPVIPEGYVMVPKEPTEEMIAAAMNCDDVLFNSDESFCVQFGNIYEAMLAAAPQLPDNDHATVPGKWIPVSERMPPSRYEVLVGRWWGEKPRWCCKWATYIPGNPDSQSSGWLIPGASWTPTHWMPLPAAPQEVCDEK